MHPSTHIHECARVNTHTHMHEQSPATLLFFGKITFPKWIVAQNEALI